jgi:hypothetical protein
MPELMLFVLAVIFSLGVLEVLLHWILWRIRVINRGITRREKERLERDDWVLTEEEEYAAYRAHW